MTTHGRWRSPAWPQVVLPLLGGLLALLTGLVFLRAFELPVLARVVVPAAAVPVVVSVIAQRLRWSLLASAAVSLGTWLVVTVLTTSPAAWGEPSTVPGLVMEILRALTDGWSAFLSTTLRAQPDPDLLIVPQVLTWLAAATAAELILRTRSVLLPVAPACLGLTIALVATVPGPGSIRWTVAGFAVVAVALAGLCRDRIRSEAGNRAPVAVTGTPLGGRSLRAGVLAGVLGCALLTGLFALWAPSGRGRPYDVRSVAARPVPVTDLNPVVRLSEWNAQRRRVLFTTSSTGPGRWQLAVLDRYDGATWSSSALYYRAGLDVAIEPDPRVDQPPETVEVAVENLDSAFLPSAGRTVGVRGRGLAVDPSDGTLVGSAPDGPGRRYQLRSLRTPEPRPEELAALRPTTGATESAATRIAPGLPAAVTTVVHDSTAGANSPYQRLRRLETYLRANYVSDPNGPPGVSYGHVRQFLTGSRTGTPAEFATVFALGARSLGLPSRVVVGFDDGEALPGGHGRRFRGRDALVWAEVQADGLGWVPFFPAPAPGGVSSPAPGEGAGRASAAQVADSFVPVVARDTRPPSSAPPDHAGRGLRWWLCLLLIVPAARLALSLGLVVRRERRRRLGTSRHRVVGAWADTLDAFRWSGVPVPEAATQTEAVGHGIARVGEVAAPELVPLAAAVREALYSPCEVDADMAQQAWRHADRLRPVLRHRSPLMTRIVGAPVRRPASDLSNDGSDLQAWPGPR